MLDQVDVAVREFLSGELKASHDDVEVSFAWPGSLVGRSFRRPVVNAFLWAADFNRVGGLPRPRALDERSGDASAPWLDLQYVVTIWCEREQDEHRLLGRAMAATWMTKDLPIDFGGSDPTMAQVRIGKLEDRRLDVVWAAMERRLRPAFDLIVTTVVDAELWRAPRT